MRTKTFLNTGQKLVANPGSHTLLDNALIAGAGATTWTCNTLNASAPSTA